MAGVADVADAVGEHHDAGDAIGLHFVHRQPVGDLQAIFDVRRAARLQGVDGLQDLAPFTGFGRFEQHGPTVPVGHNGNLVVGAEFVHQQPERPLHEAQPVLASHGAGNVDGEHQRCVLPLLIEEVFPLQSDPHQPMVAVAERGWRAVNVDGKGVVGGGLVALVEIVDELLHPYGVLIGQVPIVQEPAGNGV